MSKPQVNMESIKYGHDVIEFPVEGYWSNGAITVRVNRSHRATDANWSVDITHSSGGRDTNVVADGITATENFANVLLEAAEFARELRTRFVEFEAAYSERRSAEDQAARADRERIAALPRLTEERAKRIVKAAKTIARDGKTALITVFNVDKDLGFKDVFVAKEGTRVAFRVLAPESGAKCKLTQDQIMAMLTDSAPYTNVGVYTGA